MACALAAIRKVGGDERGNAILELAVVLPVFLTIALGVFEFGRLIYSYQLIQNGVRDGARYVAGLKYEAGNTTLLDANLAATQNIAARGVATGGSNRVSWWAPSTVTVSYTTVANGPTACSGTRCYRGGDTIVLVTVNTSVAYSPLGFLGYLGLGAITLTSTHQERLFGVR
jgi:Flp pilus assembly protein TadG